VPKNEWQERILRLLRLRYGFDLVEVPDKVDGDAGIEAFSRDGCCYQCYAVEGEPSTAERYEKNRDKMTGDIRKFTTNTTALVALFGVTKIKRWVFVIPTHDNKALVSHAQTKAAQVRDLVLSYVDGDFEISIATEDAFDVERNALLREGLQQLNLLPQEVHDDAVEAFADANSDQITKLTTKIAKVAKPKERTPLKELLLGIYLKGEDALERLRAYPELYEAFIALRNNRAKYVAMKSMTPAQPSQQFLHATINEFIDEVRSTIKGLGPQTAELLAHAASVGWLLECHLDFPDDEVEVSKETANADR